MVLMKGAKSRKNGGNTAPQKRKPFPEVSQEKLDEVLHNYCRSMGIKKAFNLYQYKNLQASKQKAPIAFKSSQSFWITFWK